VNRLGDDDHVAFRLAVLRDRIPRLAGDARHASENRMSRA
jgi:hypothetical protein